MKMLGWMLEKSWLQKCSQLEIEMNQICEWGDKVPSHSFHVLGVMALHQNPIQ